MTRFHILFAGGHLVRVTPDDRWVGTIDGKRVSVAGTVWGDRLPKKSSDQWRTYPAQKGKDDLSVWMTHHDILIPGYENAGRIQPHAIEGVDLVINGHVHRRLPIVTKEKTAWVTAGNITRRSRSDATRDHIPAVPILISSSNGDPPNVLNVTAEEFEVVSSHSFTSQQGSNWSLHWVMVPHERFDDVFYPNLSMTRMKKLKAPSLSLI